MLFKVGVLWHSVGNVVGFSVVRNIMDTDILDSGPSIVKTLKGSCDMDIY